MPGLSGPDAIVGDDLGAAVRDALVVAGDFLGSGADAIVGDDVGAAVPDALVQVPLTLTQGLGQHRLYPSTGSVSFQPLSHLQWFPFCLFHMHWP